ncbi:efflux RND transporter periplasmic adaptor subunit [Pseudemcibacter aquimaris]|uniref:efflux RND transporter periplasmic adaptor subunit n=1 Tax=Pseudemcibacter aquimaris TaxID=2857064 RepID=UPI002011E55B|nr:efflux RND transporter periplasmic adaptor subunit [Pseudemcibacter aquimaris]MCC3860843.1 efflux RND transporter periplasmic adaptor subunit [Pseudemcibacter aquimaris]WDU59662.1 efflux RND transporter periplasmic adaptor subunit [Pseudemcibacter aquimaris]
MNKSYRTAALIVVGIALVLLSGVFFPSEDADEASAAIPTAAPVMSVSVIQANTESYQKDIVLRGYTESKRTVNLKSQIRGRIVSLPVEKGMRVSKGDVVCRIDLEDREANYAESVALVKQRELEFAASENLFAKGHRSETQHSAAKSALDAAVARSTRMKLDLDNTNIRAPFDGVINDRQIEVGDYMKDGDVCATIMEEDPFLVVADISENQVSQAKIGDAAYAILQNGRRLEGKIRYIASIADANTRTFRIELEVDNPNKDIRDGITAELFLNGNDVMAQKISPATLVLNDSGLVGVRTVDSSNRVEFKEIEIVGNHESGIWVTGVSNGENIIVEGHEFVKAGESVSPVAAQN